MDLSIIVPVYNVQDYIVECIESILELEGLHYEIIIVNDGTTDESIQRIKHLIDIYHLHVINQENKGLSAARNIGIEQAIGKYICFVDSDDRIDACKLKELYDDGVTLDSDIIVGNYIFWKGNKKALNVKGRLSIEGVEEGPVFLSRYYGKEIGSVVWRNIYKRSFLLNKNLKFIEGIYFEDNEWMPRAFFFASRISCFDISFYDYRFRDDSITNNRFSRKKMADCFYISRLNLDFCSGKAIEIQRIFMRNSYLTFLKCVSSCSIKAEDLDNPNWKVLLEKTQNGSLLFEYRILVKLISKFPQATSFLLMVVKSMRIQIIKKLLIRILRN